MDPLHYRKRVLSAEEQVADLGLFAQDDRDPPWLVAPTSEIERAFKAFHAANPNVYQLLERAAIAEVHAGVSRIGIAKLVEDIRYNPAVATGGAGAEPFKLNNNYRALYARLLVHHHPELTSLFLLRERREPDAKAS